MQDGVPPVVPANRTASRGWTITATPVAVFQKPLFLPYAHHQPLPDDTES